MSSRLHEALWRQILADLGGNNAIRPLAPPTGIEGKRDKSSEFVLAPFGEDMNARLRSIRLFIAPEDLAVLLHCDVTTVYRLIDAGMPVEYGVDPQVGGRSIKIYPPQVADWRCERRNHHKAFQRKRQRTSSEPCQNDGTSKVDNGAEPTK
jgi:hypothetical protein